MDNLGNSQLIQIVKIAAIGDSLPRKHALDREPSMRLINYMLVSQKDEKFKVCRHIEGSFKESRHMTHASLQLF